MPGYNFKDITAVPTATEFVDVVLSTTQRTTPTVVRKGWNITRIRSFYMRKVRYTKQTWSERLSTILEEFPRVDDIHPFYGDLLNVLYDKDHYKLALGQLSTARNLISKVGQDYVRLLKYGDSLYRCKQLKRAALGRMCTVMKKHTQTLAYLEQVRQHLSRLPSIDPGTRTLIVCGYPNVGKSSFMNKVTRADVEVQPYAFTTKSLYVGHTDYKYLRWQVIDTPGILDRPLEERNTIEMQSVTALAHLRAAVLYVMDLSEQCGYTLVQQVELFKSIQPLFANKPLVIVLNKTDLVKVSDLSDENIALLREVKAIASKVGVNAAVAAEMEDMEDDDGIVDGHTVISMSALRDERIMEVKRVACEKLLSSRVEMKSKGKKASDIMNRVHVAIPKPRDSTRRPPVIPKGVAEARASKTSRRTEKDLENENGGAGVYSADFRKSYTLKNDSWKYDIIPEIMDGKNIADFVDPEIEARLVALEEEEEELEKQAALEDKYRTEKEAAEALNGDDEALLHQIEEREQILLMRHRERKAGNRNSSVMPRTHGRTVTKRDMRNQLGAMGIDTAEAEARQRRESRGRKRTRSKTPAGGGRDEDEDMDMAEKPKKMHSNRSRSVSRGKAAMEDPKPGSGLRDLPMKMRAQKMADRGQKYRNTKGFASESDRRIPTKMPKHLFSGKSTVGKRDWR